MATLYDQRLDPSTSLETLEVQDLYLTHQERERHRLAAMLPSGQAVAIVLERGQHLSPGDILLSSSGQALRIKAQPEALMKITADTRLVFVRLVYHLANRHVRAMLEEAAIYIEPDSVLADMAQQIGAKVEMVHGVFEPEAGAYAGGHHHHGQDQDTSQQDNDMGRVGEMLSIEAHQGLGRG